LIRKIDFGKVNEEKRDLFVILHEIKKMTLENIEAIGK
jgi:hypothetical protein